MRSSIGISLFAATMSILGIMTSRTVVSENSRTLSIISFSSRSITPASLSDLTNSISASSFAASSTFLVINSDDIFSSMNVNGKRKMWNAIRKYANRDTIFSNSPRPAIRANKLSRLIKTTMDSNNVIKAVLRTPIPLFKPYCMRSQNNNNVPPTMEAILPDISMS